MLGEFVALATVSFYDDVDGKSVNENILITEVNTFTEAMMKIEDYYGRDLETVTINLFEGPFVTLSDENVDIYATKGFD